MTGREWRDLRNGLLFISPWLLGFAAFSVYPLVMSIYYSFTEYNVIQPPAWVGLDNYRELFFEDPLFWKSLYNTCYFTLFAVPLSLAASLGIAVLLNIKIRGIAVFRTIFFLPSIVPIVASSVLWLWVLNPDHGLLNSALREFLGFDGPGWVADPAWSKPSLILMSLWGIGGAIVIFLAGLADVPDTLYEVAELDGAGPWRKFWHVTLPMVTPTILFTRVMGLIASFQFFTQAYVMTHGRGTPADSLMFYALYLYRESFYYLRMGYASSMAWMMFVVILVSTIAVLISSRRWVYYQGE
ncbi:MAG: sugar ABC transporter permease [Candidatus Hydrogenedentes bacterium]|nr:sugar ABC transporter permease [Candidatus Hydrogenedentota bacterium]